VCVRPVSFSRTSHSPPVPWIGAPRRARDLLAPPPRRPRPTPHAMPSARDGIRGRGAVAATMGPLQAREAVYALLRGPLIMSFFWGGGLGARLGLMQGGLNLVLEAFDRNAIRLWNLALS